jgi:hypothetical protein
MPYCASTYLCAIYEPSLVMVSTQAVFLKLLLFMVDVLKFWKSVENWYKMKQCPEKQDWDMFQSLLKFYIIIAWRCSLPLSDSCLIGCSWVWHLWADTACVTVVSELLTGTCVMSRNCTMKLCIQIHWFCQQNLCLKTFMVTLFCLNIIQQIPVYHIFWNTMCTLFFFLRKVWPKIGVHICIGVYVNLWSFVVSGRGRINQKLCCW